MFATSAGLTGTWTASPTMSCKTIRSVAPADFDRQSIGFGGGLDVALHLDERVSEKNGAPTHRALVESVVPGEMARLVEAARQRFRDAHSHFKGPYPSVLCPHAGRGARASIPSRPSRRHT